MRSPVDSRTRRLPKNALAPIFPDVYTPCPQTLACRQLMPNSARPLLPSDFDPNSQKSDGVFLLVVLVVLENVCVATPPLVVVLARAETRVVCEDRNNRRRVTVGSRRKLLILPVYRHRPDVTAVKKRHAEKRARATARRCSPAYPTQHTQTNTATRQRCRVKPRFGVPHIFPPPHPILGQFGKLAPPRR